MLPLEMALRVWKMHISTVNPLRNDALYVAILDKCPLDAGWLIKWALSLLANQRQVGWAMYRAYYSKRFYGRNMYISHSECHFGGIN